MTFNGLLMLGVVLVLLTTSSAMPPEHFMFTRIRDVLLNVVGRSGSPKGLEALAKLQKTQPAVPPDVAFPCNVSNGRSAIRPDSIHRLRPGDIDVIAAFGDSLTAGNGAAASNVLQVLTENRGISWSIGGQGTWREHLTLPNIVKEFNPALIGQSTNDSFTHHRASQFNVAEAGSMSRDMPYMAKILVKRIMADKRVDFENDWKLVTLMIGGNDYCLDICYADDIRNTPKMHKQDLITALDYLRDHLPRTLVNVVISPNMDIVRGFKGKSMLCFFLHLVECPCIFGKVRENKYAQTIKIIRQWQRMEEEVSLDPRYRTKDDFAVVMQPFVADLKFPTKETSQGRITDFTFLSEDCFHFSQKGYARAANAMWNNMLEPIGEKSRDWSPTFEKFRCPTEEHPYIYTHGNSHNINVRVVSSYN